MRAQEFINEITIGPDDLVDVFIKGKHRGEPFSRLVARGFPNKNLPLLIRKLETKYNINPNAVVYGPSRIKNENAEDLEEKINKDIFSSDWRDELPIIDGRYNLVAHIAYYGRAPNLKVEVFDPNWSTKQPIAYCRFRITGRLWWKHLEAGMVHVDSRYRRQGIASAMYQYVNKLGNTIKPSFVQLPDGKFMWKGFKKKNLLATENEVQDLEKDLQHPYSYDAIDHMMTAIADKNKITPQKLHDRFVKKHGKTPDNWIKDRVNENFADGRVKGRSRPGRVKRAGASCSGSVSELRARAKKYGGERGRMYHWCANMKSGKKS